MTVTDGFVAGGVGVRAGGAIVGGRVNVAGGAGSGRFGQRSS
ncbi:hypothetical protein [Nocardia puris]|uniref:Uncharacterized protein n=1 Tax=Nocardia puris TaxID=208602 RepID=A0A366DJH5_9NOCA|nr:hypothetical protein [Nocardia puris]RBO90232.1 hypothetical protein DFR74_106117 [Nocardia puris]